MKLAVINQKGGSGKTTTAVNLGTALAKLRKHVLLIDMDPQASLTFSFGIQDPEYGITQVIEGDCSLKEAVIPIEGVHVLPAEISLANVELNLREQEEREFVISKILVESDLKRYDYIIFDCPPSLSLLTINALTAADAVLIPMQLEVLSVKGLDLIMETIEKIKKALNKKLKISGILPVMVDARKKLSMEILEYIKDNYKVHVFENTIRTNVKASEAPSFGQSVISYAPKSNSSLDYQKAANELISI